MESRSKASSIVGWSRKTTVNKYVALWSCLMIITLSARGQTDRVDDYLSAQMVKNHIPAVSVAVIQNGKLIKLRSYGVANLEWNARATPDTAFQLASATKPFTGLLLMKLVEAGKLSLDAPLTTFFPQAPASWQQITVRHLAAHTSGLTDALGSDKLDTVDQIVTAAMKQPLRYEPGARSEYGFTDYVVLTKILEQVAGKPYPLLLRQMLVEPLGLVSTAFNNEQEQGPIRLSDPLPKRADVYLWQRGSQKVWTCPV